MKTVNGIKFMLMFLLLAGLGNATHAQQLLLGCEEDFAIKVIPPPIGTPSDTFLLTIEDLDTEDECPVSRFHWIWELEGQYYEFGESIKYRFRHGGGTPGIPPVHLRQTSRYKDLDEPIERSWDTLQGLGMHTDDAALRLSLSRSLRPDHSSILNITGGNLGHRLVIVIEMDEALYGQNGECAPHLPNWTSNAIDYSVTELDMDGLEDSERAFLIDHPSVTAMGAARADAIIELCTPAEWELDMTVEMAAAAYQVDSNFTGEVSEFTFSDLKNQSTVVATWNSEETVVGSWDPNAIAVSPDDTISGGDTLTYTIFYENVGTATEHGVIISNIMPEYLTQDTFDFEWSHKVAEYQPAATVVTDDSMRWIVVGGVGPGDKGWLRFKTVVPDDVPLGDSISNRAVITFQQAGTSIHTNVVTSHIANPECSGVWCLLHSALDGMPWWKWCFGGLFLFLIWLFFRLMRWRWPGSSTTN